MKEIQLDNRQKEIIKKKITKNYLGRHEKKKHNIYTTEINNLNTACQKQFGIEQDKRIPRTG